MMEPCFLTLYFHAFLFKSCAQSHFFQQFPHLGPYISSVIHSETAKEAQPADFHRPYFFLNLASIELPESHPRFIQTIQTSGRK